MPFESLISLQFFFACNGGVFLGVVPVISDYSPEAEEDVLEHGGANMQHVVLSFRA